MVWFFARAHREGFLPEGLSLAEHGVRFLRERLWDHEHGAFYWSVAHDGSSVEDASKRLYAQSFALYGLSEYARGCQGFGAGEMEGGGEGSRYAMDMVEVLRQSFHDEANGGFLSELDRDLRPTSSNGPRGGKVNQKTVNEHLHVLEAFSAYLHVATDPWVDAQLRDLVLALTGAAFRKAGGSNTDFHRQDWTPLLGPGQANVSYGHDVETVWLVAEACVHTGTPFPLVADWARAVMESTLRWGWDRRNGGVYFSGPLNGPAHTRRKIWWVQAEVLIGSLAAYRLMGDPRYADLYLDTLEWVLKAHVDWEGGEWFPTVETDGRVTGDRAGIWKSAYHNGRAMMECLKLLSDEEPFRI
jgi:mannobiose 2-epimerase